MNKAVLITNEKIFNAIVDSISSTIKINKTSINKSTDLNKITPPIDSLNRIEIIMELEKKIMDVSGLTGFSLDESTLENGSTVEHFIKAVKIKLKSQDVMLEDDESEDI